MSDQLDNSRSEPPVTSTNGRLPRDPQLFEDYIAASHDPLAADLNNHDLQAALHRMDLNWWMIYGLKNGENASLGPQEDIAATIHRLLGQIRSDLTFVMDCIEKKRPASGK